MLNCDEAPTPMNAIKNVILEDGNGRVDAKLLQSIVGGLIYLTQNLFRYWVYCEFSIKIHAFSY